MQVLGLNGGIDPIDELIIFRDAFGLTYPILLDAYFVYQQYRQSGATSPYPLDYVIDQQGIVAYFSTEYDPERTIEVIDGLLGNLPALSTDPEWLSFGAVEVGQEAQLLIDVRNDGIGNLQVHALATGGDEFQPNLASLFIPAGGSRAVMVTFAPGLAGSRRDTLWLASNDPALPLLAVPLQGIGGDGVGVADFNPNPVRLRSEPNPFTNRTRLSFSLPAATPVWLEVFDLRGRQVRTLLSGESIAAGEHWRPWDGRDESGETVASGIYFTRLRSNEGVLTRKITLLR